MFLSATTPDVDVYALLEEADSTGKSLYVREGMLRASLRKEGIASWDDLALPWHRAYKAGRQPLEVGEVVEMRFAIEPVTYLFNAGNRLWVTLMAADRDNTEAPPYLNATMTIHLGVATASGITLPLLH